MASLVCRGLQQPLGLHKNHVLPNRGASPHRCCESLVVKAASTSPSSSRPSSGAAARTRLGDSDLMVSKVCLGTMTWGDQNTEAEAHEQLSYAWDCGVNFLDTAEM